MENWGLHYKRLREVKPDLVMVSISAMGHTGPWRDFVGFAPTFHALSGLISKTSGNLNPPADIDHPYADLITGLYAALAALSALEYKDRTGEGQHIDLSALEAICTFLGPAFIESQLDSKFQIPDSRLEMRGKPDAGVASVVGQIQTGIPWSTVDQESGIRNQKLRSGLAAVYCIARTPGTREGPVLPHCTLGLAPETTLEGLAADWRSQR